jgi:hypothetical protein
MNLGAQVLLLALLVACGRGVVLSTADFTGLTTSSQYYVSSNPVGVAFEFPELVPLLTDNLLQNYLLNSQLQGNWYSVFEQTAHMPPGYRYNCSLQDSLTNSSSNCTLELNNQTLLQALGNFIYNTSMYYAFNLGWDQTNVSFTANYANNALLPFIRALYKTAKQPFNIELADRGNLYGQMGVRSNYTGKQFVQDCNTINNVVYGLIMTGPGTTDSADSSWYSINGDIYNYCGFFTLRAVVFPDPSFLTIDTLLSENYTSQFLKRRMTAGGASYLQDFNKYLGSISDLRLVDDPMGVPGLTDSFAACIWAIEMMMEFFFVDGFRIDFYNSFKKGSKQGVFGTDAGYTPSPLYSALLMADLALLDMPYIDKAVVTAGTSASIRIYGIDNYNTYGVLLLNKDTDRTHVGEVAVKIKDPRGLHCVYLTASDLNATSGVTIGGVEFVGNRSAPVGNYTELKYEVDVNGYYQIPLNYSQVVYCVTKDDFSYNPLPTEAASAINAGVGLLLRVGVMAVAMALLL